MVKQIDIKGKKYPINISFQAIAHLQLEYGITPEQLVEKMIGLEPFFYYSLKAGCEEMGQELDIKREEIPSILDSVWMDFMKLVPEFFAKSSETKKKNL